MRTARIYVAVAVLIFDVVVEYCLFLRRLVKYGVASFSLLLIFEIYPFERLVGLIATGVEVLIDAVVP